MKWLNGYRIRLVLVGVVAAVVIGSGSVRADFTFGEATNLGPPINSDGIDFSPCISADGLSLYLVHDKPPTEVDSWDISVAMRASIEDPWSVPVNLGPPINGASKDYCPSISADGLELYFASQRPGPFGTKHDLWVTMRSTTNDEWGEPVNLGSPVNTESGETAPCISSDGLTLFFRSGNRPGGFGSGDIWMTTRTSSHDPWGEPQNLGPMVNSSVPEYYMSISSDGLVLFFDSTREGGLGNRDLYYTRRRKTDDDWTPPVNLGPAVNSLDWDGCPNISADGSTLYFCSGRPGMYYNRDIWQVSIDPIVDLNGDGIVDAADMCIMVDQWGTDDPLCDIGPMPWGDGIVDVEDLKVLAEHLFEEVDDPTLMAHWPLDETEGMIVTDSAGDNNGYAVGDPVWLPEGGQVNGTLEFDGVDDFISAPAPLNPADGPFSVLAWVKGGAPGQAIISAPGGQDWLSLDPSEGHMMTELASAGRSSAPLISQTVINDGDWHRIGLIWDGSNRILCVDEAVVAQDTQDGLENPGNGLYIGCGDPLQPDTFFSGMIDDVRIYNRAVIP